MSLSNTGDNLILFDPSTDQFIQAIYRNDPVDNPTTYAGFSATATILGGVLDFGTDSEGTSRALSPDGAVGNILNHIDIGNANVFATPGAPNVSADILDYGDAPATYATLLADGGARHNATGPTFGPNRDNETDGTPSVGADGDDTSGTDDEDGVTLSPLRIGDNLASVSFTVANAPIGAVVDAWIDFNQDGSFGGPYERVASGFPVTNGDRSITFPVPSWAVAGNTIGRFRISTSGVAGPAGLAADGEVEDHVVQLVSAVTNSRSFAGSQVVGASDSSQSVFAADINRDGSTDVVAGEFINRLDWFQNDGTGSFLAPSLVSGGSFANDDFVVDIDGDHDLDIIHTGANRFNIYVNDGSQNFSLNQISTKSVDRIYPADLDGDGDLDIASSHFNSTSYFRNDGNLNFTEVILGPLGGQAAAASDIDNDGDIDIAVVRRSTTMASQVGWFENDGSGSFTTRTISTGVLGDPISIRVADVDVDGDADLVMGDYGDRSIRWYANDGNENFTLNTVQAGLGQVRNVEVADLDGDGLPDLIASGNAFSAVIYFNNGDTTFERVNLGSFDYSDISVGDIDGDGDLDVVGGAFTLDQILWFENLQALQHDFGDAPDSNQSGFAGSYPVTLAENGARHATGGPTLGAQRDSEGDGVHSPAADADDTTGSPDDEDGIAFAATILASSSSAGTGSVDVNLQNADGTSNRLDAWIDFNRDGDWSDAGEQIFSSFDLGTANGIQSLSYSIPQDTGGNVIVGDTYARFRLSTAGGLTPTGAANDGEVEDLRVTIVDVPALTLDVIATAITEGGGTGATTVTITRNTDPTSALDIVLTSSDPSEATIPTFVTIPAGQASVTVNLDAVDDTAADGTQAATISASALGGFIPDGPTGLDSSFGIFGKQSTQLQALYQPPEGVIATLPDGKILAISEASSDFEITIVRHHPDGTVDTSFGSGGVVLATVGSGTPIIDPTDPCPTSIVVAPDGKFYMGGVYASGVETPFLARFNPDGSLDASFGDGGVSDLASIGLVSIEAMELTADGKLIRCAQQQQFESVPSDARQSRRQT